MYCIVALSLGHSRRCKRISLYKYNPVGAHTGSQVSMHVNRGCGVQAISFNSRLCCETVLLYCCRKIRTTDGAERTMRAGEVLFQDDVEKSPAKKTPKHWSGKLSRP